MIRTGIDAALFSIAVLLAAFIVCEEAAQKYMSLLYISFDKHLSESEQLLSSTEKELTLIKKDAEFYDNAVKVVNAFTEMAGSRFTISEIRKYSTAVIEESEKYGIDPMLVMAVVATESGFSHMARSGKGALGMMQLLPSTAFYISGKVDDFTLKNASELFDPETNLRLGVAYLAYLINKTGNTEHALIAYNYGPGNLHKAITSNKKLPRKYIRSVMRNYDKLASSI